MRTARIAIALLAILLCAPILSADELTDDLDASRAVFQKNLDAIRNRDRDAYLSTYLQAETLARTGATGFSLGYADLEASAGSGWPDTFEGLDLALVRVKPGVVYGTYRYRVRYGAVEQSGLSERFFVKTDAGWKIAVTTAFEAPAGTPPPPRAIVGATLVDGRGGTPIPDSVVILRGGRIDCAGTRADCEIPSGVDVIDAKGLWLTPGLVDAHVHFSQTGWADGRPDALDLRKEFPYEKAEAELRSHPERFFRSFLCSGVTSVFDVGGYPWTIAMASSTDDDSRAPHVRAAGPLLSTLDHWLNLPAERQFVHLDSPETGRSGVAYLASRGAAAIKVWLIVRYGQKLDELAPAVMAAGAAARNAGLPLIVHATELDTAKVALRAGARLLVHSVWDKPIDDEFLSLMKENGATYCPTMTVARGYVRMFEGAAAGKAPSIDDPNGCVTPWVRERVAATAKVDKALIDSDLLDARRTTTTKREEIMAANLKRVAGAGIPIAMGTDAGNPMTLHGPSVYAEMESMQAAGLTPMQVLVASTRVAAATMGIGDRTGTVEKGKDADLVLLGADPTSDIGAFREVKFVVRGGVVRSEEELVEVVKGTE